MELTGLSVSSPTCEYILEALLTLKNVSNTTSGGYSTVYVKVGNHRAKLYTFVFKVQPWLLWFLYRLQMLNLLYTGISQA